MIDSMVRLANASVSTCRYDNPLRQVATRPTGDFRAYRNAHKQAYEGRLRPSIDAAMVRSEQDFDENEKQMAKKATSESMFVMGILDFGDLPMVEFTDSGTLTFQWERDNRGVLLSFTGDGIFGFSLKRGPADSYSGTYQEREVKEGVDPGTSSEIIWLSKFSSNMEAA